jgi:hypothetical protein
MATPFQHSGCDRSQTDVGEAGAPSKGGDKDDVRKSLSPSVDSDKSEQSRSSKSKHLGWTK